MPNRKPAGVDRIKQRVRFPLSECSFYVLLVDDLRFDLRIGDIFIGKPYLLDPTKTSVGFRVSDGFDPGCNQYNADIRPLTEEETNQVLWAGVCKIKQPS